MTTEIGPSYRLAPGKGNLDPTGPQFQAGWVPTLRYTSQIGAKHTSAVTELAEWVQTLLQPYPSAPSPISVSIPSPPSSLTPYPLPHRHCRPRLQAFIASALSSTPSPALTDLNLDETGKPFSFSSAIRGLHGKEWTLADERELVKLLVALKCLLPVMRPAKNPTYLKSSQREVLRNKQTDILRQGESNEQ